VAACVAKVQKRLQTCLAVGCLLSFGNPCSSEYTVRTLPVACCLDRPLLVVLLRQPCPAAAPPNVLQPLQRMLLGVVPARSVNPRQAGAGAVAAAGAVAEAMAEVSNSSRLLEGGAGSQECLLWLRGLGGSRWVLLVTWQYVRSAKVANHSLCMPFRS
jgi:hypothetical protein